MSDTKSDQHSDALAERLAGIEASWPETHLIKTAHDLMTLCRDYAAALEQERQYYQKLCIAKDNEVIETAIRAQLALGHTDLPAYRKAAEEMIQKRRDEEFRKGAE